MHSSFANAMFRLLVSLVVTCLAEVTLLSQAFTAWLLTRSSPWSLSHLLDASLLPAETTTRISSGACAVVAVVSSIRRSSIAWNDVTNVVN